MDLAPNRLISAGLVNQLAKLGWEVHYETQQPFLDIPYNPIPTSSPVSSTILTDILHEDPNTLGKPKTVQRLPDPDIGRMKRPRLVSAVNERVAQQVGGFAGKGWLPLTLGGDHSLVSLGSDKDQERLLLVRLDSCGC